MCDSYYPLCVTKALRLFTALYFTKFFVKIGNYFIYTARWCNVAFNGLGLDLFHCSVSKQVVACGSQIILQIMTYCRIIHQCSNFQRKVCSYFAKWNMCHTLCEITNDWLFVIILGLLLYWQYLSRFTRSAVSLNMTWLQLTWKSITTFQEPLYKCRILYTVTHVV